MSLHRWLLLQDLAPIEGIRLGGAGLEEKQHKNIFEISNRTLTCIVVNISGGDFGGLSSSFLSCVTTGQMNNHITAGSDGVFGGLLSSPRNEPRIKTIF
jgi:hypothetical protein